MNAITQKIIFVAALLVLFNSTYSQTNTDSGLVSVRLSIIGKGTPFNCSDSSNYYFTSLKVLNTQDTVIRFWIMSCSWPTDNWVINSSALLFRFCGCDSNVPVEIVLSPQKSVEFYSAIKCYSRSLSNNRIKAGLIYFTSSQDIFNNTGVKGKDVKTFWSNEVELRDNLYSYEIK